MYVEQLVTVRISLNFVCISVLSKNPFAGTGEKKIENYLYA